MTARPIHHFKSLAEFLDDPRGLWEAASRGNKPSFTLAYIGDQSGFFDSTRMAYPNATLLRLTKYGLDPTTVKSTDLYKTLREFFEDPRGFVEAAIAE